MKVETMCTTSRILQTFGTSVVVVLCLIAQSGFAQPSPPDTFDQAVADIMSHWGAPGAVIMIVKDGQVLVARGYGETKAVGGAVVTASTLATVGSVTKPFTATALSMLVDDGISSRDDPVQKHIPEFAFAGPYQTEHTTLRDLITHRAGLPAVVGRIWDSSYTTDDLLRDLPTAEPTTHFRERMQFVCTAQSLAELIRLKDTDMISVSCQTRADDEVGFFPTYLLRPMLNFVLGNNSEPPLA